MRIAGEKLMIELDRRHVLVGGLIAFVIVVAVVIASIA